MPKKGIGLACNIGNWDEIKAATGATWFLNWSYSDGGREGHIPLFAYDYTSHRRAKDYAIAHPGSYHLIGNEPDCLYQDNMTPAEAAFRQAAVCRSIYSVDPAAKCIIGGISSGSAWARWMVQAWPVDVPFAGMHWHIYNWRDEAVNLNAFLNKLKDTLEFTKLQGSNCEYWLSEWGVIGWGTEGLTNIQVMTFMRDALGYLNAWPRITKYAWFCWQKCEWQDFPVRVLSYLPYAGVYKRN